MSVKLEQQGDRCAHMRRRERTAGRVVIVAAGLESKDVAAGRHKGSSVGLRILHTGHRNDAGYIDREAIHAAIQRHRADDDRTVFDGVVGQLFEQRIARAAQTQVDDVGAGRDGGA